MESSIERIAVTKSARGWSIIGEMDVASALQLSDAFAELPDTAGASVDLDLAGVTFIDSSGLTALLRLADSVEAAGGTTVIRNPSETVTKLLAITQLESRFGLS